MTQTTVATQIKTLTSVNAHGEPVEIPIEENAVELTSLEQLIAASTKERAFQLTINKHIDRQEYDAALNTLADLLKYDARWQLNATYQFLAIRIVADMDGMRIVTREKIISCLLRPEFKKYLPKEFIEDSSDLKRIVFDAFKCMTNRELQIKALTQATLPDTFLGSLFYMPRVFWMPSLSRGYLKEIDTLLKKLLAEQPVEQAEAITKSTAIDFPSLVRGDSSGQDSQYTWGFFNRLPEQHWTAQSPDKIRKIILDEVPPIRVSPKLGSF